MSLSRFEVIEVSNEASSAEFDVILYNNKKSHCQLKSRLYRCLKNNIYLQLKICFSTECDKTQLYIKLIDHDCERVTNLIVYLYNQKNERLRQITVAPGNLWHCISDTIQCPRCESKRYCISIGIVNQNMISGNNSVIKQLHKDTQLTDFELRGEGADAGVRFHRSVLASASDVLERMVTGEWREAKEGVVRLPTTTDTLLDFKDYIYLRKLPQESDKCGRLLSLAKYFMMADLAEACVTIMAANFQPETTWNWLEHTILTKDFDQLEILMANISIEHVRKMGEYFKSKETEKKVNENDEKEEETGSEK